MLLDTVSCPADLRRLSHRELDTLASEIRSFVVDAVNTHGGHLGSNLGVVELTLALHRVFNSPRDPILWDTGHQAYVHKLVTGRADGFSRLRQAGGLSGYPSRDESEHDWVENSHASTILSYAHGLATAFDRTGQTDRRIVAVVGDGSLTGGMAFEGLNNLGHSGRPVIIILNDNGRSYAPTISKLSEGLIKLRPEAGLKATPLDVTTNPKKLRFVELDAAQLARALDDLDAAAVNTNFALSAGLQPGRDSIAQESAKSPYVNLIAVREQDKDKPWVAKLVAAYHSDAVKQYVKTEFKGAVLTSW